MKESQRKLQGDRYRWPVSDEELNRRLSKFQEMLKEMNVDCAITQCQSPVLDAGIRYFIDQPTGFYSSGLLIPSDGDMVYLCHGNENDDANIPKNIRNVKKMILKPYCQMFDYTDGMGGKAIAEEIKKSGYKTVGIISPQLASYDFISTIKNSLKDVEFIDITREFYILRAKKSEEEWNLLYKTVDVHDKLMYTVPGFLKAGMMEYELRSKIAKACVDLGCDSAAFVAVGSAPQGSAAQYTPHFSSNRRIEEGDSVCVMIEICGPGGMYGELARTFCLGEPSDSLKRLFNISKECQEIVAKSIKPGVKGSKVNEKFDEVVTKYGISKNLRFGGHGMGYDMMEAPAISPYEDMEFQDDSYIVIHPELTLNGEYATCSDNFRVTKDGAKRLSKFPQEIVVL